jgi:hypothetical protein
VTLNADAAATPEAAANATLAQGEFSITANGHAIVLSGSPLLTVTTDKQTDAFDAAAGYVIVESGSYVYTPTKIVAMIGETPYTSFDDAVEAYEAGHDDGDVITVVDYDSTTMVAPDDWKFVTDTSEDPAVTTLERMADVARVESTGRTYTSLAKAIAAANSEDTVTLLADVSVEANIVVGQSLTVNLDGHTVTNLVQNNRLFNVENMIEFTIDGTAEGSAMVIPAENTLSLRDEPQQQRATAAVAVIMFIPTDTASALPSLSRFFSDESVTSFKRST